MRGYHKISIVNRETCTPLVHTIYLQLQTKNALIKTCLSISRLISQHASSNYLLLVLFARTFRFSHRQKDYFNERNPATILKRNDSPRVPYETLFKKIERKFERFFPSPVIITRKASSIRLLQDRSNTRQTRFFQKERLLHNNNSPIDVTNETRIQTRGEKNFSR